jgi:preprotein translocase subunit SecE
MDENNNEDLRKKKGASHSKGDKNVKKTMGERVNIFYKEIKGEYIKVIWPSRQELVKQTVTVMITSLIIGAVIVLYDGALGLGLSAFADLVARYGTQIGL